MISIGDRDRSVSLCILGGVLADKAACMFPMINITRPKKKPVATAA